MRWFSSLVVLLLILSNFMAIILSNKNTEFKGRKNRHEALEVRNILLCFNRVNIKV